MGTTFKKPLSGIIPPEELVPQLPLPVFLYKHPSTRRYKRHSLPCRLKTDNYSYNFKNHELHELKDLSR